MTDDGSDGEADGENRLGVEEQGDGTLLVSLDTVGANYHSCTWSGAMTPLAGVDDVWRSETTAGEEGEDACAVTLRRFPDRVEVAAEGCRDACGMRATLDSIYALP